MSKFYAAVTAQRQAARYAVIHGVTGGLEAACGAFLAIGGLSPMMALGDDLLCLMAGSIDAPETMAAGSMCAVDPQYGSSVALGQRWVRR